VCLDSSVVRGRSAVVLAIALVATWAVAGPAQALEPGVFIDPGSPAGKEYSVPLSVLRGASSGRPGGGGAAPPLFGIGISPSSVSPPTGQTGKRAERSRRTTGAQPGTQNSAASGAHSSGASGGPQASGAASVSSAAPAQSTVLQDLTRHGSAAPSVALFGALVVLGGFGLGVLLLAARRRVG
jgi:hypothetical protein